MRYPYDLLLAEFDDLRAEWLKTKTMLIELEMKFYAQKYNQNQPRVPAGSSGGGQWTSGGGANGSSKPQSVPDVSRSHSSFNQQGAADYITDKADILKQEQIAAGEPNKFGEDRCGHYVGEALVHGGGVDTSQAGHWPADAKNFGPWLEKAGFQDVAEWNGNELLSHDGYVAGYTPQTGDVVVLQPYQGGNPSGHTAMYNGNQWVSDFKQRDLWGGPDFRAVTPPYVIYRH